MGHLNNCLGFWVDLQGGAKVDWGKPALAWVVGVFVEEEMKLRWLARGLEMEGGLVEIFCGCLYIKVGKCHQVVKHYVAAQGVTNQGHCVGHLLADHHTHMHMYTSDDMFHDMNSSCLIPQLLNVVQRLQRKTACS